MENSILVDDSAVSLQFATHIQEEHSKSPVQTAVVESYSSVMIAVQLMQRLRIQMSHI